MALKNLEKNNNYTLDVDAFVIEENKEYAKYTYRTGRYGKKINDIKFYIRAANDPAVKKSIKTIKTFDEGEKAGYDEQQLKDCWHEEKINIAGNKTTKKTVGIAVHAMDKTEAFNLATQLKEIITKPEKPDTTRLPGFENEPEIRLNGYFRGRRFYIRRKLAIISPPGW